MTSDRDAAIQNLFDTARADLDGKEFTARVMSEIDRGRRWSALRWLGIAAVLIACGLLLSGPVVDVVNVLGAILPASLIEIETAWLAQLLSPINSVAAVVGAGILIVWGAYRKLFA